MTAQTLYHGSNQHFTTVSLDHSRDRRDFGRGFYTTTLRPQAESWAHTLLKRHGGEAAFLYTFHFNPDPALTMKSFPELTGEWLEMVKEHRIRGGLHHDFDVVTGPVANDNTMPTIALYVDGLLSEEATLVQLAYFQANDQVSFHTPRAIDCLTLVETRRF